MRYEQGGQEVRVGDVVRAERDETKYPARGTWPRYRGRVGTVVQINERDREIGVAFEPVNPSGGQHSVSWFRSHELILLAD